MGIEFKLKCVLPDDGEGLDLRDLNPLDPGSVTQASCAPETVKVECLGGGYSSDLVRLDREGLMCLRDMTRLPSGFSILAETENVVVLRHILRDAVVIVPKKNAGVIKGVEGTVQLRNSKVAAPSGYITEWFPCGYSLFRVESGHRPPSYHANPTEMRKPEKSGNVVK